MAGRVQPSPSETPKEKEKHISAFWFMVEFLAPKVCGTKGWEVDMCSIPLQQTNFMASDETMTKLALENMWQQWHAAQEVWKQRREDPHISGRKTLFASKPCVAPIFCVIVPSIY
jgi:hypothetical protein